MTSYSLRYGLTNCSWSSCREGCTAEFFKCHQVRVSYTPDLAWEEGRQAEDLLQQHWAHLDRTQEIVRENISIMTTSLITVIT